MDRLITILAGLVLGLRGARRFAFEAALEGLREAAVDFRVAEQENNSLWDRIDRLETERDSTRKELVEERERADALQRRIDALPIPVLMGRDGGNWRLMVRRRLLADYKIYVIKALRTVTQMGLKEAKEWVETRIIGLEFRTSTLASPEDIPNSSDWITLAENANAIDTLLAIDTLFNQARIASHAAPPTLDDISFRSSSNL
jgi:hypothetical protein